MKNPEIKTENEEFSIIINGVTYRFTVDVRLKAVEKKKSMFKEGDVVYSEYYKASGVIDKIETNSGAIHVTFPIIIESRWYLPDGRLHSIDEKPDLSIRTELAEQPIFEIGDMVYNHEFGQGVVYEVTTKGYCQVQFDGVGDIIWLPFKTLSFTPYTLEYGGFSQQRQKACVYVVHREGIIHGCFDSKEKADEYANHAIDVRIKKLEVL